MVGGNVGEVVAAYHSLRDVIDHHITDMVASIGGDGEGLVRSVVNRGVSRRYRPVGTGGGGDGVGVDSKCSSNGVVSGNAGEGVAAYHWCYRGAIHRQGFNMVAAIGADGEGLIPTVFNLDMVAGVRGDGEGLVRTGVNHLGAGGRYRATGTGAGGDGEGINGEAGSDGMVGLNVFEGIVAYRTH